MLKYNNWFLSKTPIFIHVSAIRILMKVLEYRVMMS